MPLALAAALEIALGGTAAAQTLILTKAPADSTVEFVVNATAAGPATLSPDGTATLNVAKAGIPPAGMDANIYVDTCNTLRRVLVIDRGHLTPDPAEGCSRAQISGLFLVRPVSTLVVDVSGSNPSVLLRQGAFTPPDPDAPSRLGLATTGLVLFGGAGFGTFGNAGPLACGDATTCNGGDSGIAYHGGVTYWLLRYLGVEAAYVKPAEVSVDGSGTGYRFDSSLDAHIINLSGKVGIPVGPVRLYGQGGGTYHRATLSTSQTMDAVTTGETTVPGGTQIYSLKTGGWGWSVGGGIEVWLRRGFGLYAEGGSLGIKGADVNEAEGRVDDRVTLIVIGARIRIGG